MATETVPRVEMALNRWQAELLDLTKANRLLYFRPGSGALPLIHPLAPVLFDGLTIQEHAYTFYRPAAIAHELTADEQLDLLLATAPANGDADHAPVPPPSYPPTRLPRANEIIAHGEPKSVEA